MSLEAAPVPLAPDQAVSCESKSQGMPVSCCHVQVREILLELSWDGFFAFLLLLVRQTPVDKQFPNLVKAVSGWSSGFLAVCFGRVPPSIDG